MIGSICHTIYIFYVALAFHCNHCMVENAQCIMDLSMDSWTGQWTPKLRS